MKEEETEMDAVGKKEEAQMGKVRRKEEEQKLDEFRMKEEEQWMDEVGKKEENAHMGMVRKKEEEVQMVTVRNKEEEMQMSPAWKNEEEMQMGPVWKKEEEMQMGPDQNKVEEAQISSVWKKEEEQMAPVGMKTKSSSVFSTYSLSYPSTSRALEPQNSRRKGRRSWWSCISPLNAHRLQPIRQKTEKAVVTILETEQVCVELLKEFDYQEYVKEVLLISHDGNSITVYHLSERKDYPLTNKPLLPQTDTTRYSFESLPEKHWRTYQHASRFVQLVRSKTPKITYFSRYAKCILMENSPCADFEVWFYDGAKIHKTHGLISMTEKSGESCLKEETDSSWKEDMKTYVNHANEKHRFCLALEFFTTEEEAKNSGGPIFPMIVGRQPGNPVSPQVVSAPSSVHSSRSTRRRGRHR
ncbi:serine/threonine-protein kinase PLK4-like isoform X2 [Gracilinanus agilis]|uniref:serine/threonine-protein kinase PLK4-like isoform X2 n=1 Tax=Gracilinanus agilis TaxID=191870 RepID=UPI001CFCAE86|nr:serine/threonine-protein kinase PLK4-like isoform X2 [Gracilinanus agilis]